MVTRVQRHVKAPRYDGLGKMEEHDLLSNSSRTSGPKSNADDWELEDLYKKPVSAEVGIQEGFLVMISKLTEMIRLILGCISGGAASQLQDCTNLANEVHQCEKILTRALLASRGEHDPLNALIRLPFQLEGIGENLETILSCCRIKMREGLDLTGKAESALHQLLAVLLDMMSNLRDAFRRPDAVLLESIICECREANQKVQELRLIPWPSRFKGPAAFETTRMYLDALDAIKSANEGLGKICASVMEWETVLTASGSEGEKHGEMT